MFLHKNAFTHKRFYIQTLLQTRRKRYRWTNQSCKKNYLFDARASFRAKWLPPDQPNSQKKQQVLTLEPGFVRKLPPMM